MALGTDAARRFAKNRLALIGLGIVVVLVIVAALAPVLAPYDPAKQSLFEKRTRPGGKRTQVNCHAPPSLGPRRLFRHHTRRRY